MDEIVENPLGEKQLDLQYIKSESYAKALQSVKSNLIEFKKKVEPALRMMEANVASLQPVSENWMVSSSVDEINTKTEKRRKNKGKRANRASVGLHQSYGSKRLSESLAPMNSASVSILKSTNQSQALQKNSSDALLIPKSHGFKRSKSLNDIVRIVPSSDFLKPYISNLKKQKDALNDKIKAATTIQRFYRLYRLRLHFYKIIKYVNEKTKDPSLESKANSNF